MIRRALRVWLNAAVLLLPIWPIVGMLIFEPSGWTLVGLLIAMPILFVALLIVALIIGTRPSVRESGAVSWTDAAVIGAWSIAVIGFGFFTPEVGWWLAAAIVAGVVAFWFAITQTVREVARRSRETMEQMRRAAAPTPLLLEPDDQGEYIVIDEGPTRH